MNIKFFVNNKKHTIDVEPESTLLEILRDKLYLTGTKCGCNKGECGACSVIFNDKVVTSCLVLSSKLDNSNVITIEGLMENNNLHPLQKAFIDNGAVQCGFCIPGMIIAAKALLDNNKNPTDEEILDSLAGNLCRCTGYAKIIKAVKSVII